MRRFRIYYAAWDGVAEEYKYWTHEGRGFVDALRADTDGCQVILQENPDKAGRKRDYDLICKTDVYVWRPDTGWLGVDRHGFETYARQRGFPKYWIYGYSLLNGPFQECHRRAVEEGLGD